MGRHGILCPPRLKKWGEHVPHVPHQITPMVGMLVKLAHKNWKIAKEDKFCAGRFDAFLKLRKNEGNVDVRNMLSDSRKKIIDQTKLG